MHKLLGVVEQQTQTSANKINTKHSHCQRMTNIFLVVPTILPSPVIMYTPSYGDTNILWCEAQNDTICVIWLCFGSVCVCLCECVCRGLLGCATAGCVNVDIVRPPNTTQNASWNTVRYRRKMNDWILCGCFCCCCLFVGVASECKWQCDTRGSCLAASKICPHRHCHTLNAS